MNREPITVLSRIALALALFAATATVADARPLLAKGSGTGTGELVGLGDKCLDVFMANPADGTPVVLWACGGGAHQQWRFESAGDDLRVVGLASQCLIPGVVRPSGNQETAIGSCAGPDALWNVSGSFPGDFNLVHKDTGFCLDVLGSMTGDGTPILLFECHGGTNQDWSFRGTMVGDATAPALILPRFTVDRSSPGAPTTLFAVRNQSDSPVTVLYAYYAESQDLDAPTVTEVVPLAAHAVRTVNLRDIVGLPVDPTTNRSAGYVGISVVDPATLVPIFDPVLDGDYFRLESDEDFASGDVLIDTDPSRVPAGLCNRWDMRFFNGGAFDGGTSLTFFVDGNPGGSEPIVTGEVYDEAGNPVQEISIVTSRNAFEISSQSLGLNATFGAIEWRFQSGVRGHVSGIFRALGRFSVGMEAFCNDGAP